MSKDINDIEGMPAPPAGYRWKLVVSFDIFFRVIAVREKWPHRKLDRNIRGVVLYEQHHNGTPPPHCVIRAAERYLDRLSELNEDTRRKEMLREYL